jgi:hypothetical protein
MEDVPVDVAYLVIPRNTAIVMIVLKDGGKMSTVFSE